MEKIITVKGLGERQIIAKDISTQGEAEDIAGEWRYFGEPSAIAVAREDIETGESLDDLGLGNWVVVGKPL